MKAPSWPLVAKNHFMIGSKAKMTTIKAIFGRAGQHHKELGCDSPRAHHRLKGPDRELEDAQKTSLAREARALKQHPKRTLSSTALNFI